MSVDHVKSFIEKFNSDEAFRNQINQAATGPEWLAIAREAGFEFDQEELQQVIQEAGGQSEDELTEEQLESVAGGVMGFDGKGNDVVTEEITFLRRGGKKFIDR